MKLLCVISARSGSKGVPLKNIRLLSGKPLITYNIESALDSNAFDKVIVSTDSAEIASIAESSGAEVPFLRPIELSNDNASLIQVNQHAWQHFKNVGFTYDSVMSLQPTAPFIGVETLQKAVKIFKNTDLDSLASISEMTAGHPYTAKRLNENGIISEFVIPPEDAILTPRQKREKAYYLTGGFYLRRQEILNHHTGTGHCLGKKSYGYKLTDYESIDINSEIDFSYAEFMLEKNNI